MVNRKHVERMLKQPLPHLAEDERIYLQVDYRARYFAKVCNCGFDGNRKLWFTGAYNENLKHLVHLYGVHDATSEKAMELMEVALEAEDRDELRGRLLKKMSYKEPYANEGKKNISSRTRNDR